MLLEKLLLNIEDVQWPQHQGKTDIFNLSCDSREDQRGALFVALGGFKFKGVDFVADVIAKGAAAVLIAADEAQAVSATIPDNVVMITAKDPKALLRTLAERFYDTPSRHVQTIGITGTNGKTTFTYLLESILHAGVQVCGVIGTVNYRIGREIIPANNTTPGFIDLQRFLARLRECRAKYCVMEVSSHALHQGRVDGIHFAAAVFSNLTQDHLDYHSNMEDYFQAKAMLFKNLPRETPAVINADDPYAARLCALTPAMVIKFGIDSDADVQAQNISYTLSGTNFDIAFPKAVLRIKTPLIGKHNVSNILAAAACAFALGFTLEDIQKGIENVSNVPGRLEVVQSQKGIFVFIDYAHTEDGLINVLRSLRAVSRSKIITVFGCGGDRDRTKRPKMGAAVCTLADYAIITSDNPRSEDPQAIVDDIIVGFNQKNYEVCLDRKEAIGRAIKLAQGGDIVLLAGKGHEDYQILRTGKVVFNEAAIVREFLNV